MNISKRKLVAFTCVVLTFLFGSVSSAATQYNYESHPHATGNNNWLPEENVEHFIETKPSNLKESSQISLQENTYGNDEIFEMTKDELANDESFEGTGFVEDENDFIVDVDISEGDEEPIDPEHYRLRVGDILQLAIYGEPESYESIAIDPSGNLSYLFAHDVKAVGKTVKEFREELQEKLRQYYRQPILLVTPQQYVPQFYTILGEVNIPGVKEIHGNSSLIKAFAEAGGFTTRIYRDQTMYVVDFDHCFLARKGECILKIDFEDLVNGDFTQNVKLEPEDFIYIASNEKQRVFVLGEVARPGTYDYFGTMSLVEAISIAGGLTADASSRVSVVRGSISYPTQYLIDANRIMRGRACDFELKPADIVYIPPRKFNNLRLFVQSAIRGFVGNVASQAGNNAFIQTTPAAAGETATDSTLNFGPASAPTVIVP